MADSLVKSNVNEIRAVSGALNGKATVYLIPIYITAATAASAEFRKALYPALEEASPFASEAFGTPKGGLGMVQMIHFHDSEWGDFHEMLIIPGVFEYPDPKVKGATAQNRRMTAIYTDTRSGCYNARNNCNFPKHMARFDWKDHADGSTTIAVYPYKDGSQATDPLPWFSFKYTPGWLPGIPMSTKVFAALGVDLTLVQPPLPTGKGVGPVPKVGSEEVDSASGGVEGTEEVGTKEWVKLLPYQYTPSSVLGWGDTTRPDGSFFAPFVNAASTLAVKMTDADVVLPVPERWATPGKQD
ncbi:hypothetical protein Q8F55_002183 [Vanrija albida]|uniref:Uncharacterized protein n=1 Tax=Vanrija albida TaxID=181172 RepID=A0ABR3Q9P5_9TREE